MLKTKKAKIALFSGLSVAAVALIGGALVFGGVLGSCDQFDLYSS